MMNCKSLVAAAALAVVAGAASAADQVISLTDVGNNAYGEVYSASFAAQAAESGSFIGNPATLVGDSLLSGGTDVITFSGAAAGLYQVTLNGSAQFIQSIVGNLNGASLTVTPFGQTFTLFTTVASLSPDFTLTLSGSPTGLSSLYSGNITVSAIPEPQTYALLLAGLGAVGFMARRRRRPE